MKNLGAIVFFVIAIIAVIFLYLRYKLMQTEVQLADVGFSIKDKKVKGSVKLLVTNPANLSFKILDIDLGFYIDNNRVVKFSEADTEILFEGNETFIKVNFQFEPLQSFYIGNVLQSIANFGKNKWRIRGSVQLEKGIIKARIPIDYEDSFSNHATR